MQAMAIERFLQMAAGCQQAGRLADAEATYRRILAEHPDQPDALYLLGMLLAGTQHYEEAANSIRRAIALVPANKPELPQAYSNLGQILFTQGRLEEAMAAYRQALAIQPKNPEIYHNLGVVLHAATRLDEAVMVFRQAITLQPKFSIAWGRLGDALCQQGRCEEGIAAYRQALALRPDFVLIHNHLGNALQAHGRLTEAVASLRRLLSLSPDNPSALNSLGNALQETGQVDAGIAAYRQALAIHPKFPQCCDNLLMALNYVWDLAPTELRAEHERWGRQHAALPPKRPLEQPGQQPGGRRLRVGYVSPDFREHSVSWFFVPLLTAHDRAQVEIFCYAQNATPDQLTQFIQKHCDGWRDITRLSDEQAAQLIHQDRIDILVDLAGHTAGNRLLVFARKPAPLQVSYLGYPATTGLGAIDYRLTDAYADPPGLTETFYTEKLIRLPECFLCYAAPPQTPAVADAPVLATGHITFGSFNNFAKVSAPVLDAWTKILRQVPGCRLILKARSLGDSEIQKQVRHRFQERGVEPHRLDLFGTQMPSRQHMEMYGRVDMALDTFPYNGTTTTCEAMWMGVPVIALAGNTHASRVGVSLLSNVGLPELIAATPQGYVQLAVNLAGDVQRLQRLRQEMRARMAASPLMNPQRLARTIEQAYRSMWRTWCGSGV